MKTVKSFILFIAVILVSGCSTPKEKPVIPAIVPQSQKTEVKPVRPDIIGAVEPVYILPMKSSFDARIDTGATTSSIDAEDIRKFERDGEKWVSFTIENARSGEKHTFEKPVVKSIRIKRSEESERRVKVILPVKFGGKTFSAEFTLADREDFDYQALIGRNILTGSFIVDTSVSHTLK